MAERLELRWEYACGDGVRDPVLARTMARFESRLGSRCVTLGYDRALRGAVEGAYISLFPLAVWAVDCWWFALHEGPRSRVRSLRKASTPAEVRWHQRHSWLAFREGFALPDIVFSSEGEEGVRVDCFADPPEADAMPLTFLAQASAVVPRDNVETELCKLVEAVLARCEPLDEPGLVALRARWDVIRSASRDEATAFRRAARLGLDGLDAEQVDDALSEFLAATPAVAMPVFDDLLDAVDAPTATRLADQSARLAAVLGRANGMARRAVAEDARERLREVAATVSSAGRPYERGYDRARALRKAILGADESLVGEALDHALARSAIAWAEVEESEEAFVYPGVKAVVAQTDGGPYLATRPGPARRFERARSLHMLLTASPARLVTTSYSPEQQASRAFAAELLAPAAWLADRIRGASLDWEGVEELAAELGVGDMVVRHQIENHGLAEILEG